MRSKGVFIGAAHIEHKLEGGGREVQGLDSLDWYGLHVPESRGVGEDLVICDQNFDGCSFSRMSTAL